MSQLQPLQLKLEVTEEEKQAIRSILSSGDGKLLVRAINRIRTRMSDYANSPALAGNPYNSAHANGGAWSLKALLDELSGLASLGIKVKRKH